MHLLLAHVFILVGTCGASTNNLGSVPFGKLPLGTPWPMPQSYQTTPEVMTIGGDFQFAKTGQTCDILEAAFERYYEIMFETPLGRYSDRAAGPTHSYPQMMDNMQVVSGLTVDLQSVCQTHPTGSDDESYKLSVSGGKATLVAPTIWGALYGLETFSQIVYEPLYGQPGYGMLLVNESMITDSPRFAFRGMLLDTSRHYIHVGYIKQFLDLMAMNKMNTFHWHIVDDPSFPYMSRVFPDLHMKGAFQPYTHIYTQEDIKELIEYARFRGIRVIPEFDSPGHTQSWGKGQPGLLTECYTKGKPNGAYGPVDPTKESTYEFMKTLLSEIFTTFPDKNIHLGGDEVSFACWQSNPNINAWMKTMNISGNYAKLEEYYVQRVLDLVKQLSPDHGYLVWQEVFDNGVKLKPDTVVEVWIGNDIPGQLAKVTSAGYRAILSACWYLDWISMGEDWPKYYTCDPHAFNGTDAQKKLVIGGEACMWGEFVDGTIVISRTWPRASATAERLWSSESLKDANAARDRLEVHRCRMIGRGYNVEPLYVGYCPHVPKP